MRLSWPMPRRTSLMSAPHALAEVGHLVDEADLGRQQGVGDVLGHLGTFGRHDQERLFGAQERGVQARAATSATSGRRTPTTTRSGFLKSSIAAPSLRNSGLLATSHSRPVSSLQPSAVIRRLVPTGTVLLVTTMHRAANAGAIASTTAQSAVRSAEPSSGLRRADGEEDELRRP